MELKDKIAVVTGVSKGIGKETVLALLNNDVKVAGWSRSNPEINHENFRFIQASVSDYDSVKDAYEKTKSHFGENIQILINNAGIGFYGPVEEMPEEEWKMMFDTNVHGVFYCTKLMVPTMKILDEGHIINIGSIAGRNPVKNMVGYAATKHALTGISHSLYQELRAFGIKVTCIYPGSVRTNFFDHIDSMSAHENMMRPQDIAQSIIDCLETHPNYLPVDLEIRPLRPKGK